MWFILSGLVIFGFMVFAAIFASFFTVVIERTWREESFVTGRSKCDHCHHQLAWYDNIPLLSFWLLKGKCRYCQKPIDRWFFQTEAVAVGYALLFSYLLFTNFLPAGILSWQIAIYFVIGLILLFIVLSDIRYMIIPDFFVVLLGVVVGVFQWQSWRIGWLSLAEVGQMMAAVLCSGLFFWLLSKVASWWLKKEALGMGDLKLILPLALWLSWPKIGIAIFASFIIGGFFAMLVLLLGKKKWGQALPFGPFLVVGALIALFWGDFIWQWYFHLL